MATQLETAYNAATGRQAKITGGGAETDAGFETKTLLAGVTLAASPRTSIVSPRRGRRSLMLY